MRHLDQDAGAIPGVGLGTAGAAVIQVLQDLDALSQDRIRTAALDVGDEAEAAGVLFELRVVEPLLAGAHRAGGGGAARASSTDGCGSGGESGRAAIDWVQGRLLIGEAHRSARHTGLAWRPS